MKSVSLCSPRADLTVPSLFSTAVSSGFFREPNLAKRLEFGPQYIPVRIILPPSMLSNDRFADCFMTSRLRKSLRGTIRLPLPRPFLASEEFRGRVARYGHESLEKRLEHNGRKKI